MTFLSRITRIAAVLATSAAFAGLAQAGGTNAGTNVSNTFTLDYSVGTNAQPTITNDPASGIPGAQVQGTPTQFTVDRLIDLTVVELNSPLTVAPNSTANRQIFRLTNLGNDNQAYDLTTAIAGGGTYTPGSVTLYYFVDTNGNDTLDGGETLVAYSPGDDTADIAPDGRVIVYVDSDVPATAVDGNTASIVLTADTLNPVTSLEAGFTGVAGVPVVADAGGNDLVNLAENVLADGAGSTDAANAGDHSATGVLNVASADLVATKTITVFEDQPANDAACIALTAAVAGDQYSVPGACIQYVIQVENTGSTAASALDILDQLPAEVTFLSASLATTTATGFADDPAIAGAGPTLSAPASGTNCDGVANCTIQLNDAILAAGEIGQIRIWAKVD